MAGFAPTQQLAIVCQGLTCALRSDAALEVVTLPPLMRVPGVPPYLLGLFVHLGQLLPLIALALLMRRPRQDWSSRRRRAVILESSLGRFGVPVSEVMGPGDFSPTRPPTAELPGFVVGLGDAPVPETLAIDPDLLARTLGADEPESEMGSGWPRRALWSEPEP